MNHEMEADQTVAIWAKATIDSIMLKHRMVTVSHQPIAQWQWPAMTMDFTVDKSVDISQLQADSVMNIQIRKTDGGDYIITEIKPMNEEGVTDDLSPEVEGVINSIMTAHRMINISRGAIPKWNRPAAMLDFIASEDVDLTQLVIGQKINFRFKIDKGIFVITNISAQIDESEVK